MDRFYTKPTVLQQIADWAKEKGWLEEATVYVDFAAGDGYFSSLLQIPTENYDIQPTQNALCKGVHIEKQDWFNVKQLYHSDTDAKIVIGLNPPFGYKSQTARAFVKHALRFHTATFLLIVPRSYQFIPKGFDLVFQSDLQENAFYEPDTNKEFSFPTKMIVLKRVDLAKLCENPPLTNATIIDPSLHGFTIRVSGRVQQNTQLLIRRAGVYANQQFYCKVDDTVVFIDRGRTYKNTDWVKKGHSVQEGGNVSEVHGSSNPKRSKLQNNNSKTGWNWYKVDFAKLLSINTLCSLAKYLAEHPPDTLLRRSNNISILAKSAPPNINLTHLKPLIATFLTENSSQSKIQ